MSAKSVDVEIMGREFTIACSDDERQDLLDAVSYLAKKMHDIRDAGKVVGLERIAIMAALNLSHEVLNTTAGGIDIGSGLVEVRDGSGIQSRSIRTGLRTLPG